MRFVTRPPRADELGPLVENLCAAYLDVLTGNGLPVEEAAPFVDAAIRAPLLGAAESIIVSALEDTDTGEIVGGVIVTVMPSLEVGQGGMMWVKEAYRGEASLARKLVRHAEALVRERGAKRFDIGVVATNPRLHALYERLGFVTIAHTMSLRV